MDTNQIMLSFFFGLVGAGMFMYGKKAGRLVPLSAGVGLIALPYFIPNVIIMLIVCSVLSVLPLFLRNA